MMLLVCNIPRYINVIDSLLYWDIFGRSSDPKMFKKYDLKKKKKKKKLKLKLKEHIFPNSIEK